MFHKSVKKTLSEESINIILEQQKNSDINTIASTLTTLNSLSPVIESKIISQFNQIKQLFIDLYQSRNDVELDFASDTYHNNFICLVKYKSIIITNSHGSSHTIRDLVFLYQFGLLKNNIVLSSYNIYRLSQTEQEYQSNYIHSHYNNNHVCLGNTDIVDLYLHLINRFDINKLELFLYSMESFLQWESIEGTPYKYFEHLGHTKHQYYNFIPNKIDMFLSQIDHSNLIDYNKLNIVRYKNKIDVQMNDYLYQLIFNQLFTKNANSNYTYYNFFKYFLTYSYGRYMNNYTLSLASQVIDNNDLYYWKGEFVPLNIIYDEEQNSMDYYNETFCLHPKTISYIENYFTLKIYEKIYDFRQSKITQN